MTRFAVGVEYDGGGFSGWQIQLGLNTVQAEMEAALSQLLAHPVSVTGAGRTDSGVHSRGQVVHFDTDASRSERALVLGTNTSLPPAIAVRWARAVPDHFSRALFRGGANLPILHPQSPGASGPGCWPRGFRSSAIAGGADDGSRAGIARHA
jgi:hypothetical protein